MAARLRQLAPGIIIFPLRWDPALAMPGAVDLARLSPSTIQTVDWIMQAFGLPDVSLTE